VNYYGSITVDCERELAQLDEKGHPERASAGPRADYEEFKELLHRPYGTTSTFIWTLGSCR
jgi:hypothetical protein